MTIGYSEAGRLEAPAAIREADSIKTCCFAFGFLRTAFVSVISFNFSSIKKKSPLFRDSQREREKKTKSLIYSIDGEVHLGVVTQSKPALFPSITL